jgi:HlyD family secretion protein
VPVDLRRSRIWLPVVAILLLSVLMGAWWLSGSDETALRTAPLAKGDVVATVNSTGALEAVTTVEVGTQVSGVIQELRVDYNDPVEAGQILAIIDPTLLEADVRSAEAQLSVRRAEYERDRAALERIEGLVAVGAATAQELEVARSAAQTSAAQSRAARVALERAQRNLSYSVITSPVTGTVLVRDVQQGQTVNAGMSAPRLFVVAGDLSQMQILATVDEADIGRVHRDQRVEFVVQAWPDRKFQGEVSEVRLQSTLTDNVVTYTVVVRVDNADLQLLPGMTATVDFVVGEARDVWVVPNAALRFSPEGEGPKGPGPQRGRGIWVQGEDDALVRMPVEVGLTDGKQTEIRGEGLAEGLAVVTGVQSADAREQRGSKSPFQSAPSQGGGPPRGGGF